MKKEIGYIYIQVLFLGKSSHIRFCNTELRVQYMWFWVNMFRVRDLRARNSQFQSPVTLLLFHRSEALIQFCDTLSEEDGK